MATNIGKLNLGSSDSVTFDGRLSGQEIKFTFNYDKNGNLKVTCNIAVGKNDFYTARANYKLTIDGTELINKNNAVIDLEGYYQNKNIFSGSKKLDTAGTYQVKVFLDAYASGYGPTPSGGTTYTFNVSVSGVYTKVGAPTITITPAVDFINPGESLTPTLEGTDGQNNSIKNYSIAYLYSDTVEEYTYNSFSNFTTWEEGYTLTPTAENEGKYIYICAKTIGSVSGYDSDYTIEKIAQVRSKPQFSGVILTDIINNTETEETIEINYTNRFFSGVDNKIENYTIHYQYQENETLLSIENGLKETYTFEEELNSARTHIRFKVQADGENYSSIESGWSDWLPLFGVVDLSSIKINKDEDYENIKEGSLNFPNGEYFGERVNFYLLGGFNAINNPTFYQIYSLNQNDLLLETRQLSSEEEAFSFLLNNLGENQFRVRIFDYYGFYENNILSDSFNVTYPLAPSINEGIEAPTIVYNSDGNNGLAFKPADSISEYFLANGTNNEIDYCEFYIAYSNEDGSALNNIKNLNYNGEIFSDNTPYYFSEEEINNVIDYKFNEYYKIGICGYDNYGSKSKIIWTSNSVKKTAEGALPPQNIKIFGDAAVFVDKNILLSGGRSLLVALSGGQKAYGYKLILKIGNAEDVIVTPKFGEEIEENYWAEFDCTIDKEGESIEILAASLQEDETYSSLKSFGQYAIINPAEINNFKDQSEDTRDIDLSQYYPYFNLLRATAAVWGLNDIKIPEGMMAYDLTNNQIRIGAEGGNKKFSELEPIGDGGIIKWTIYEEE